MYRRTEKRKGVKDKDNVTDDRKKRDERETK